MSQHVATVLSLFLFGSLALAHPKKGHLPASRGNTFNPDIGVNALLLYQNSSRGNDRLSNPQNGFGIQEVEIQFTADVDPYSRVNAIFAVHPEIDHSSGEPEHEYHFEPEELYAESLAIPLVTLKAGKFKTSIGRHNLLHTHVYPFIDAPLVQQELLGSDGHNDSGVSAAVLLPLSWYSELTVQVLSGNSEPFHASSPNSMSTLAHFDNLWELSSSTTLQWGLSALHGKNDLDRTTSLWGTDLTIKWRPVVMGRARSLTWSTEAISRTTQQLATKEDAWGFVSYLQYQFAQRWWIQGRGEYLQLKDSAPGTFDVRQKQSVLLGYMPSEFSGFRLQYDQLRDADEKLEHKVALQLNFSIGAHPAHIY